MDTQKTVTERRADASFVRKALIAAAVLALALLLWALRDLWLLVFAATLIAVGLRGFGHAIAERTPLGEKGGLGVAALIVVGALVGAVWIFGAQIWAQAAQAVAKAPEGARQLREAAAGLPYGDYLIGQIEQAFSGQGGMSILSGVGARAGGIVSTLGSTALDALLVLFAAAFFAIEPEPYRQGLIKLAPRPLHGEIAEALSDSTRALRKWLLGTLGSMTIMGVLVGLGLWALGVPAPLALALLAGLAQFVPVVGPILAAVPGILLALTVSPQTALWAGLLYFGASQLEANVIYPIIQKRAVSIPPAFTLFAVIGGGLLFGPFGIVLATPIALVAMVFVVRFYVRQTLREDADVPGAP